MRMFAIAAAGLLLSGAARADECTSFFCSDPQRDLLKQMERESTRRDQQSLMDSLSADIRAMDRNARLRGIENEIRGLRDDLNSGSGYWRKD